MSKIYNSLGLMSGTSMDGIDASIIQSDGEKRYKVILDKYFEFSKNICKDLTNLRDKINNLSDLKSSSKEVEFIEKKITLIHANVANKIIKDSKINIQLIGFHGQTILHNTKKNTPLNKRISIQLGDGALLAKLTKKNVVNKFRQNDIIHGGQGAPFAPIFHQLLTRQKKINLPVVILNIGGIANLTLIEKNKMHASDIGPGNCLIDQWIKKNSYKNYDDKGRIAKIGKIDKKILNKLLDNSKDKLINDYTLNTTYDTKDFYFSFVEGLSLENGAATLTEYTSIILSKYINLLPVIKKIIVCGGGRKNKFLLKSILKKIKYNISPIEDFGVNGDFVESQTFAFLAIRSYLKLPISFPETTGVTSPCLGGIIYKTKLQ